MGCSDFTNIREEDPEPVGTGASLLKVGMMGAYSQNETKLLSLAGLLER